MKAIAAMASNRVIGNGGTLPWRIKGDLQFFKKMTMDGTLFMGRKTFETLPNGLPGRKIIVLSKNQQYPLPKGAEARIVCGDGFELPDFPNSWVCGGAEIYKEFLPQCTDLYLTRIFKSYEGDVFFPHFEHLFKQWDVVEKTEEYAIVHYKRITAL